MDSKRVLRLVISMIFNLTQVIFLSENVSFHYKTESISKHNIKGYGLASQPATNVAGVRKQDLDSTKQEIHLYSRAKTAWLTLNQGGCLTFQKMV